MGCSSASAVSKPEETQIQPLAQNQSVLQPPTYPVLMLCAVEYPIKTLFKMTISAKFYLSQSLILTLQWQQRQIQLITTVITANASQISCYAYYPSFNFSNFAITQIEQVESRLDVSSKNVCFIGHGPGASVIRNLANKYNVEYNYYVLSSCDASFLEQIPQALYCNLQKQQHPLYELIKIKQSINQVVVCGPAWLLKQVRCFCLKHKLQGYGLLMLYGQYNKTYPLKWLDLNEENIVDELVDFDPLERDYAEKNYQAFIQRIQYAKNYEQLARDVDVDNYYSDSQQAQNAVFYEPIKNVLSDHQDENKEVIRKLRDFEAQWLQADVVRGREEMNGRSDSDSKAAKKPTSSKTVRQDSRSKSDFAIKKSELSQPDNLRKIVSALDIESGKKQARSQYEDSSSAINRPNSQRKSVKILPKFQSSFVGALDVEPPEEQQLSEGLDKPQVEIQREKQEKNSEADENEFSDIEIQHRRVESIDMLEIKKNAQQQALQKEPSFKKIKDAPSSQKERSQTHEQHPPVLRAKPMEQRQLVNSKLSAQDDIQSSESQKTDEMSPEEIKRQLSGVDIKRLEQKRHSEGSNGAGDHDSTVGLIPAIDSQILSPEKLKLPAQEPKSNESKHFSEQGDAQSREQPRTGGTKSPFKFIPNDQAAIKAQSRNESSSHEQIVKLTQFQEDPKTENVQQQILEILQMQGAQETANRPPDAQNQEKEQRTAGSTKISQKLSTQADSDEKHSDIAQEAGSADDSGHQALEASPGHIMTLQTIAEDSPHDFPALIPRFQESDNTKDISPGSLRIQLPECQSMENESLLSTHALQSSMLLGPDQPDAVGSNVMKMASLRAKQLDISVIPKKGQ